MRYNEVLYSHLSFLSLPQYSLLVVQNDNYKNLIIVLYLQYNYYNSLLLQVKNSIKSTKKWHIPSHIDYLISNYLDFRPPEGTHNLVLVNKHQDYRQKGVFGKIKG